MRTCSRPTSRSSWSTCACRTSTASSWRSMLREHPRYEKTAIIFISAVHLSDLDRIRGYEIGARRLRPGPGHSGDPARQGQDLRRALPQDASAAEHESASSSGACGSARRRSRRRPHSCARARSACGSPARPRSSAPTTTTPAPGGSIGRPICGASSAWRTMRSCHWRPRSASCIPITARPCDSTCGAIADRRAVATSSSRSSAPTARCAGCWTAGNPSTRTEPMRRASPAPSWTSPSARSRRSGSVC